MKPNSRKNEFRLRELTMPEVYYFETVLKALDKTLTNELTVFLQNTRYFADLPFVSNIRICYQRWAHKLKVSLYHNLHQINSVSSKQADEVHGH